MTRSGASFLALGAALGLSGMSQSCGSAGSDSADSGSGGNRGQAGDSNGQVGEPTTPPPPSCEAAAGGAPSQVKTPVLRSTLPGSWDENWLASPALVDVDGDSRLDIVAPRHSVLYVYRSDGSPLWQTAWSHSASDSPEHGTVRMWPSAVVGDLNADGKTEIAVSAHPDDSGYNVAIYDREGELLPGWPLAYGDTEVRSIAGADVDGDGVAEVLINKQAQGPATNVFETDGTIKQGWPQVGQCEAPAGDCIDYGGFNQNIGAGDLDGDGTLDVVSTYDAIGFGAWHGDGQNFLAHDSFEASWVTGVPAYHDLDLAQQGWGTGDRSEFTYSPPVIADIDADGAVEIVLSGDHEHTESTENQGTSTWVVRPDLTRPSGWERPQTSGAPIHGDDLGANIVPTYPSPSVADLDGQSGLEILVPCYDGVLRAYSSGESSCGPTGSVPPIPTWALARH